MKQVYGQSQADYLAQEAKQLTQNKMLKILHFFMGHEYKSNPISILKECHCGKVQVIAN